MNYTSRCKIRKTSYREPTRPMNLPTSKRIRSPNTSRVYRMRSAISKKKYTNHNKSSNLRWKNLQSSKRICQLSKSQILLKILLKSSLPLHKPVYKEHSKVSRKVAGITCAKRKRKPERSINLKCCKRSLNRVSRPSHI